ncbi:Cell wall proline rich protein [Teratosphaeria destructans]|uniref:Cell wall proline rich protein n=1 Tax=Teratosphaeria destructans TaxID=418781 RepID=A0A9W7SPJ0_9PEZI|nr:Cell wall proline rich protein [Teratosphaeria destructans]
MAEVALAGHARHGSVIGDGSIGRGVPKVEMIANPDFSFPMQPLPPQPLADTNRRPVSVQSNTTSHLRAGLAHRRAVSTLPSFSFNAADTSGRQDRSSSPHTPEELASATPSRVTRKHTRGGSEFVGGDSRLGVAEAISSSPTKSNFLDLAHPSGTPRTRRGHAHRRSTAMSSHDVSEIMKPVEPQPRLSTSLPTTPLEHPGHPRSPSPRAEWTSTLPELHPKPRDPVGSPPVDDGDAKPASRRVGFSENVEFIPRPLSTISSETESSMSTARGHSVNNSITSVLSMTSPGPPSARQRQTSLSTTYEDEARPKRRNSVEVSKRVEKEGEWLRSSVSSSSMKRPLAESATQSPSSAEPNSVPRSRTAHGKKHSLSHALGLDRRRSEPSMSIQAEHLARLSAISLQEQAGQGPVPNTRTLDRKSSSRKIKDWAMSRLSRRSRDSKRESVVGWEGAAVRPQSAASTLTPGKVMRSEEPVAETDLDAVFGQADAVEQLHLTAPMQPRFQVSTPTPSWTSSTFGSCEPDDGSILDLDAALGSSNATGSGMHKPRRELHSSRLKNDFVGPGLHYHRRTESAPELVPFAHQRGSTISQASLPDVFEGEGEEEAEAQHQGGVGIQVVDSDSGASETMLNFDDGLRIQQHERLVEPSWTAHDSGSSRLSTPTIEHRPSSIMEEAIPEELSPVEIIQHDEEPRASSLTKSSDSSETPTLMASQSARLLQRPAHAFMTSGTYQTSASSSPDLARRQGSFDTSRVGTSASSVTDNRTMSSFAEPPRISTDDVPSLTSSLSTRMSMIPAITSRRVFSSRNQSQCDISDSAFATDRRKKRGSIASFSQLVGGSFSGRPKLDDQLTRPQTAVDAIMRAPKKEHRLKKLMFWRSKSKQSLRIAP